VRAYDRTRGVAALPTGRQREWGISGRVIEDLERGRQGMLAVAHSSASGHANFGLLLFILGIAAVVMFCRGMIKYALSVMVVMVGITMATGLSFLMTGLHQVFR
jgi:hypothetical protein